MTISEKCFTKFFTSENLPYTSNDLWLIVSAGKIEPSAEDSNLFFVIHVITSGQCSVQE